MKQPRYLSLAPLESTSAYGRDERCRDFVSYRKDVVKAMFFLTGLVTLVVLAAGAFLIGAHGEEHKYSSKGKRDPFVPLATGEVKANLGLQSVETIDDLKFEGVIFDPSGKSMAVLNDEVLKEGDKKYNVEVIRINDTSITIKINDREYTIKIIEEGGEKI